MILIGADPEVFVRRSKGFVSAHPLRCGTKHKPRKTKNGSIQVDGTALEFNTRPTDNSKEFVTNVRALLEDLNVVVKKRYADGEIVATPVVDYDPDYMMKLPLEARELGCEPDFNAYTHDKNPRPNGMQPFRTGSGHVHVGWGKDLNYDEQHIAACEALSMELDYYLGLPSLSWDKDNRRRELYGKAGTFRPKSYGVEYRVLSNAWLAEDRTMEFVFNQTKKAFVNWQKGLSLYNKYGQFAREIVDNSVADWQQMNPAVVADILGA